MITEEDRKVFGWLGRIPDCVMKGSVQDALAYKKIADEAAIVARMRDGDTKVARAKKVEASYYELIDMIERRLDLHERDYVKTKRPEKTAY